MAKYINKNTANDQNFLNTLNEDLRNIGRTKQGLVGASAVTGISFAALISTILAAVVLPVGAVSALTAFAAAGVLDTTGLPGAGLSKIMGARRKLDRLTKGEDLSSGKFHQDCKEEYVPFLNIARDKTYRLRSALTIKLNENSKKIQENIQKCYQEDNKKGLEEALKQQENLPKLKELIAKIDFFNVVEMLDPAKSDEILKKYHVSRDALTNLVKEAYSEDPNIIKKITHKKPYEENDYAKLNNLISSESDSDSEKKEALINKILNNTVKTSDLNDDQIKSLEGHLKNKASAYLNNVINNNFLGVVANADNKTDEEQKNLQIAEIMSELALDNSQLNNVNKQQNKNKDRDNEKEIKISFNAKQKEIVNRFNVNSFYNNDFQKVFKQKMIELNDTTKSESATTETKSKLARDWFKNLLSGDYSDGSGTKENTDKKDSRYFEGKVPEFKFGQPLDVGSFLRASKQNKKEMLENNNFFDEKGKKINGITGSVRAMEKYIMRTTRNGTELGNSLKFSNNFGKLTALVPFTIWNAVKSTARHIPGINKKMPNSSIVVGEKVIQQESMQSSRFVKIVEGRNGLIKSGKNLIDLFSATNTSNANSNCLLNIGRAVVEKDLFTNAQKSLIKNNVDIKIKADKEDFQVSYLKQPIEIIVYGNGKKAAPIAAFSFNSKDLLNNSLDAIKKDLNAEGRATKIKIACGGFECDINKIENTFDEGLIDNAIKSYVAEEYETRIISTQNVSPVPTPNSAAKKEKYIDINASDAPTTVFGIKKVNSNGQEIEANFIKGNVQIRTSTKDMLEQNSGFEVKHNSPAAVCIVKNGSTQFNNAINKVKEKENQYIANNERTYFNKPVEIVINGLEGPIGVFSFASVSCADIFIKQVEEDYKDNRKNLNRENLQPIAKIEVVKDGIAKEEIYTTKTEKIKIISIENSFENALETRTSSYISEEALNKAYGIEEKKLQTKTNNGVGLWNASSKSNPNGAGLVGASGSSNSNGAGASNPNGVNSNNQNLKEQLEKQYAELENRINGINTRLEALATVIQELLNNINSSKGTDTGKPKKEEKETDKSVDGKTKSKEDETKLKKRQEIKTIDDLKEAIQKEINKINDRNTTQNNLQTKGIEDYKTNQNLYKNTKQDIYTPNEIENIKTKLNAEKEFNEKLGTNVGTNNKLRIENQETLEQLKEHIEKVTINEVSTDGTVITQETLEASIRDFEGIAKKNADIIKADMKAANQTTTTNVTKALIAKQVNTNENTCNVF